MIFVMKGRFARPIPDSLGLACPSLAKFSSPFLSLQLRDTHVDWFYSCSITYAYAATVCLLCTLLSITRVILFSSYLLYILVHVNLAAIFLLHVPWWFLLIQLILEVVSSLNVGCTCCCGQVFFEPPPFPLHCIVYPTCYHAFLTIWLGTKPRSPHANDGLLWVCVSLLCCFLFCFQNPSRSSGLYSLCCELFLCSFL